ncbi:MAG: hypothetical protein JWM45_2657 [Pseudonocardiales bacterium]|nr:hypothetical protein [Pseudonocardiales bacterium]
MESCRPRGDVIRGVSASGSVSAVRQSNCNWRLGSAGQRGSSLLKVASRPKTVLFNLSRSCARARARVGPIPPGGIPQLRATSA